MLWADPPAAGLCSSEPGHCRRCPASIAGVQSVHNHNERMRRSDDTHCVRCIGGKGLDPMPRL